MRGKTLLFILSLSLLSYSIFSQNNSNKYSIHLMSGVVESAIGVEDELLNPKANELVGNNYYRILQFKEVPNSSQITSLESKGVELLSYIDGLAYRASLTLGVTSQLLEANGIRSVLRPNKVFKLHNAFIEGPIPDHALVGSNKVKVNVMLYSNVELANAISHYLQSTGNELLFSNTGANSFATILKINEIDKWSTLPYIMNIEPIDPAGEPENYTARTLHRSNVIASDAPLGRKYDGSGVVVGMYDDGIIGPHIDYTGRIIAQNTTQNNGDHGDHVAGTIFGAGNLDPENKGMAFGADFHVYRYTNPNSLYSIVPVEYSTKNVYINSTSYSNGCNAGYTGLTKELDGYVHQNTSLMFVFSAGNSGTSDCGYGAGNVWGNLTGGHKAGKNVIAVANLNSTDGIATSSSRGPANDGRIKPDISAKGTSVMSTKDVNEYVSKTGTSMSCPGVAGTIAQIYHGYKENNLGNNPSSGLIKGLVLNTADDLGNSGPDFIYGWGRINALKAMEVLENNQYLSGTVVQNDTNLHNIPVPANVSQLKVMVYWTDKEADVSATTDLVNNIDFKLEDPSNTSFNPWVLDPTPNSTALSSPAVRGIDDLNNMEQVTIDNPTAGTYVASVVGKMIPSGPQEYFVIYSYIMDDITITYPIGGESLVPGETELIRWDAFGNTGNFNLEYSDDNGTSWNTIASAAGSRRYYSWNVPNITDGDMRVRITRGSNSDMSDTSFSIIRVPNNLQVDWACPDSVQLSWSSVSGANSYEVSRLGLKYMDSTVTSSQTFAVVTGVDPNQVDWFAVKALGNNIIGRRTIAIEKPLGTFNCPIPNDASITEIISPVVSLPDCKENKQVRVSVRLKNEGLSDLSSIPISYQIDNQPIVTETYSSNLSSLSTVTYDFSVKGDFSSSGIHEIKVWTDLNTDQNYYNDTVLKYVETYGSEIVTLPWEEDFESFSNCGISNDCEGTSCLLREGWFNHQNLTIDDIDWRTDENGTRTSDTGPSVDHKPGTSSGNYLYTEVSGECSFKEAFMISPCIDLSQASKPEFSFWYHMYGIDIGILYVDVLYNGQWDEKRLAYTFQRGDVWVNGTLDLSKYAGDTINLRFRGISEDGPYGDIAVDDMSIIETDLTIGAEESNQESIEIYPNPAKEELFVRLPKISENLSVTITDMQGRVLRDFNGTSNNSNVLTLDLNGLAKGIYIVNVQNNNQLSTKRVVIQ